MVREDDQNYHTFVELLADIVLEQIQLGESPTVEEQGFEKD
ncbi:hypothetical protein GCM10008018_36430 [Paenibacillus marchantiophytorum]|uniref:Uncharacterized protein n=1 Tax=Paenibacillus marchantiophytorum TaxID=1619310 RepID=A0ABQ1ETT5_9BACL|nr:hypothetical protein [Paenibacillus marchantiophytorum]GFZ86990.1 hypothetical protein GCM10008018_36430 [Paenibacillus marchantiophytorum]